MLAFQRTLYEENAEGGASNMDFSIVNMQGAYNLSLQKINCTIAQCAARRNN
jgi:hypothetical protein